MTSPTREQAEARIREATHAARARLVYGTPEKYPLADVRLRILDVGSLLAAVSLLVTERDALQKACEEANDHVRTLLLAFEVARDWPLSRSRFELERFIQDVLSREALAGGGRTPTGTDSGGLRLSAEPVVEVGPRWRIDLCTCGHPRASHYINASGARDRPGSCEATVYVDVSSNGANGANAYPCNCRGFTSTTATVSPPEPVSPGAADVAEAGE